MLSVIVYGRNESYGENYPRRVAISFNCIAQVLTPGEDEIVYVDYCSPDESLTLIEAVADTLTPRAASLIRVIRVRPEFHATVGRSGEAKLPVLEAVARNIALRRIKPGQSWVLSTNSDMVFLPTAPATDFKSILARIGRHWRGIRVGRG